MSWRCLLAIYRSCFSALKFLNAIREDRTPNLLLMRHALATWEVRDLLLIPSFMFSESAVIKRPPLAPTARRAGWVGCNIALVRVPAEARIFLVWTTMCEPRNAAVPAAGSAASRRAKEHGARRPVNAGADACATNTVITSPEEVREKFRRVKPLKDISVTQRGWTLDVLNIVRRILSEGRAPRAPNFSDKRWDSYNSPLRKFYNRRRLYLRAGA